MPAPPTAPPPQTFPYDYLFKVLIIGDASVGKVSFRDILFVNGVPTQYNRFLNEENFLLFFFIISTHADHCFDA